MAKFIDLTGQKFGKLTIVRRMENDKHNHARWLCQCDCGNEKVIMSSDIISGKTKSCGCIHTIHGQGGKKKTRLYRIWTGMKTRCLNEKFRDYEDYGGRGITVCPEWMEFEPFCEWAMANGYEDNLTLDRKDNNGNYCPENCRWETVKTQENNRRNNRLITHNGKTLTLSQWAEETGINMRTIQYRLNHGWDVCKALSCRVGE